MKRYIDADKAIEAFYKYPNIDWTTLDVLGKIDTLPTADVREVVLCKDCMHNGSYDTDCPIYWNGKEYCSFGERIEEANESSI